MKILTNIKLLNWHRFINSENIPIGTMTLITGENGSGKTTLIDAIQYVLLASANSFNSAAHLNGKRKVTTYVRSKTGKEDNAYERKGAISAHIALEFYEESTDSYFVLGAVIDSNSETQEKTVRYLADNTKIEDLTFVNNNTPLSIKEFKFKNKIDNQKWFWKQNEARIAIANRLGRLESRFFDLIPKSVAFKPIDDIKDFVFTYVLDDKKIEIDELQDIVLNYKELENILQNCKERLNELEAIIQAYNQVSRFREIEKRNTYFIAKGNLDLIKEEITSRKNQLAQYSDKLDEIKKLINANDRNITETTQLINDLKIEMANDKTFIALENLKTNLANYKRDLTNLKPIINNIRQKSKQLTKLANKLENIGLDNKILNDINENFKDVLNITDLSSSKTILKEFSNFKKREEETIRYNLYNLNNKSHELTKELGEINEEIKLLEHNQRSYPKYTMALYQTLKEKFNEADYSSEPNILCEVLEIEDEQWRNAVEGYLNTQRFYIIVDPAQYDYALSIYDYLRNKKKAYGVGLINAERLKGYDVAPVNSLASVVSSNNLFAKRYINFILGKVDLCYDKNDLKNHKAAITRECMKYQNHVASAIKPEIFEIPWIGQHSYKVQLEKAKTKRNELNNQISKLDREIKQLNTKLSYLVQKPEDYLIYNLDSITDFKKAQTNIEETEKKIKELEKNKTILQKQNQLKLLEKELTKLNYKLRNYSKSEGSLSQKIEATQSMIENNKLKLPEKETIVNQIIEEFRTQIDSWDQEYFKNRKDKTVEEFISNYEKSNKRNTTLMNNAENEMVKLMTQYQFNHDFGAPATFEGFPEYELAYKKLKSSEIIEYEGKVQQAREEAEEQFKEEFLSKLQENIKEAQSEFKRLNNALKTVKFSSEQYYFTCRPNKDMYSYYEMIMDPNSIGISIFSGSFYEKYKEEIKDLFDQLTQDDLGSGVDTLIDYRNYLDFDIEIRHDDGTRSLYSKVCKEKSGGETQTPFYVAIAASFVQLYSSGIGDEAAGLIIFDEAFNNMDDERIAGVLDFIRQLPLQVIIAAPPDKVQYISRSSDTTLLIYTLGNQNFVSDYIKESEKENLSA